MKSSHPQHGMDSNISALTWDILLASFQLVAYVPRTQLVANFRPCVWSGSLILLVRSLETNRIVHTLAEKHSFASMSFNKRVYQLNRYAKTSGIFVFPAQSVMSWPVSKCNRLTICGLHTARYSRFFFPVAGPAAYFAVT